MNAFEDFDEAGFLAIEPVNKSTRRADLRLAFMKMRSAERLTLTFKPEVLNEIGGPRYDVAWNALKRLLLVKAGPQARFEAHDTIHAVSRRIVIPVPGGLVFSPADCEPEFYVDAIGKRLLIEVPADFGRRLALPAPTPTGPAVKPASVTAAEIETGNREILRALGVTQQFPLVLGGVKFQPAEARMLEALYRGKELTMEALLASTHEPEKGDDERDTKIVDVWLCKMRPKLAELDIEIKTIWGGRRAMDAASKGRLREILKAAEVPA